MLVGDNEKFDGLSLEGHPFYIYLKVKSMGVLIMSLDRKKTEARKRMFPLGAKIVWAHTDEEAKKAFARLLKARADYRAAGGVFKKK